MLESKLALVGSTTSVPEAWTSPTTRVTAVHNQGTSERSPSFPSTVWPPGSPPPTYTVTGSMDSALHNTRLEAPHYVSMNQMTGITQSANHKAESTYGNDSLWAHRYRFDSSTVPELAVDVVSFSGTNTQGPVNPYELCAVSSNEVPTIHHRVKAPAESQVAVLDDLHYHVEPPSNNLGPPLGYPQRLRSRFEHTELDRSSHTERLKRSTSETPPIVHHQPVPTNASSDSLSTLYQLSPLLPVPAINLVLPKDKPISKLSGPKVSVAHIPVAVTRMQGQKQIMDLLGSIGT
jgi:hypothetical protein